MFLSRQLSGHALCTCILITWEGSQLRRIKPKNGLSVSMALSGINQIDFIEVVVDSHLCYWLCLVGVWYFVGFGSCLAFFVCFVLLFVCLYCFFVIGRHWLSLLCDPLLPISVFQASWVASCLFVFVLFFTSVEMLVLRFLFTTLHSFESYWILIVQFLAASSSHPALIWHHSQIIYEEMKLTVPQFRLSVKKVVVLDPGHIPWNIAWYFLTIWLSTNIWNILNRAVCYFYFS